MTESPDHQHEHQDDPAEGTAPARDSLGRYKPGESGNPAGRFAPGMSGNPKGRPPGRGFRETIMRMIEDVDEDGLSTNEKIAATLLGQALGGDIRAIELILKRVWREDYEEPEQPSGGMEMENRILRFRLRMIRDHFESGQEVTDDLLKDIGEPCPWAHELEGMDRARRIRHHQMRLGICGRPEEAWGYKRSDRTI